MTIQEVARRSGLRKPTLRYYEQVGLIGPVRRDPSSGHRRYSAAIVALLSAQVTRLDDELRAVQLRRAYVAAKLSLWQARADGDGAAESAAVAAALAAATELRAGVDRG